MKLALYAAQPDREAFAGALAALADRCYRRIHVDWYSDYDDFVAGLGERPPECIVVFMDGAEGMEGVIAAKSLCRDVPVIWFSDDKGFGAQSYRLGCAYFHNKPVSPQVLSAAMAKCE